MKKAQPAVPFRASRALARFSGWVTVLGPDRENAVFARDAETGTVIRAARLPGEVIGHRRIGRGAPAPEPVEPAATSVPAFDTVKARIRAAGETLRRMPSPPDLSSLQSARSHLRRYVADDARRTGPPRAKDIDRMEEVIEWLFMIDDEPRMILSAFMTGLSLAMIGEHFGGHDKYWARRRVDAAVTDIVCRLAGPPPDVEKFFK